MGKTNISIKEFKVTLAHKRSDKLDLTNGVFIQPKLDGVRCYTRLIEGEVKMFSRNHKEFKNCKHLTTALKPIFAYYPELILDGELYNHRFKDNFNKIISLVRKSKPTQADKFESASHLQYHIYDVFNNYEKNANYNQRYGWLEHIFNYKYKNIRGIYIVKTKSCSDQLDIDFYKNKFLDEGYEGAMLRADEPYKQKRSHGLQKVKDFQDTEFTIKGYIEGNGKFKKGLGKFLGVDKDGREVEVPWQKLTMIDRRRVWATRTRYLGKIATFEYFERTPDGAYRFPQFKGIRDYE